MNTTNKQQIVKYARVATGLVRLARNSPGNPQKLVESAFAMAEKLVHVSRTLPNDREALACWRAGCAVDSMIKTSFGPRF